MTDTPARTVCPSQLRRLDHMPAVDAVVAAWTPREPDTLQVDAVAMEQVAGLMPDLARALHRLRVELQWTSNGIPDYMTRHVVTRPRREYPQQGSGRHAGGWSMRARQRDELWWTDTIRPDARHRHCGPPRTPSILPYMA